MYHAAVVMENDNIILVGGQQRHDSHKRGEIVKSEDGYVKVAEDLKHLCFFCKN